MKRLSANVRRKEGDTGMELSERKKAILKSVIDAYIRTGDPVGSKSLTEFNLSSATIRSEMNDLENMGYLE